MIKKRVLAVALSCVLISGCSMFQQESDEPKKTETEETDDILKQEEEIKKLEEQQKKEEMTLKKIRIFATTLNVREDNTLKSNVIDKVYENNVYEIISEARDEENRRWYNIKTDAGNNGWVAGWFCEKVKDHGKSFNENFYKTASQGKLDGIDYLLGAEGNLIVKEMGAPTVNTNGDSIYLSYEDVDFLTDGKEDETTDGNYGELKIIRYTGNKFVYGVKIGMPLKDAKDILGEPEYSFTNPVSEDKKEWYSEGLNTVYYVGDYNFVLVTKDSESPIESIYIEIR